MNYLTETQITDIQQSINRHFGKINQLIILLDKLGLATTKTAKILKRNALELSNKEIEILTELYCQLEIIFQLFHIKYQVSKIRNINYNWMKKRLKEKNDS
ncbi:MAG: hypothetical protein ACP6IY_19305 [Promethearchaeia archaeon]